MTNFDMSRYDVKSIANSNLPIGGGKSKTSSESASDTKSVDGSRSDDRDLSSASSISFASQPSTTSSLSFAIPIKQDPSEYWSILGYQNGSFNNTKNPSSTVAQHLVQSSINGSAFQSTTSPFNMDFSTTSSSANESCNGFFNEGYAQEPNNGTSIPYPAPVAVSSNNSYESSSGFGSSWIGPALHTFQTHTKPSLFQTPIFGIE